MTFQRDGETLRLFCVDKKPVNMVFTMHSADMTEVTDKFEKKNDT
jgi:hypothetical protein